MTRQLSKLAWATLLLGTAAFAQAPGTVAYQGLLLKSDGTPELGTVSIKFSVFANPTGGTDLWNETQNIALTQGYYATALGEVTALPAGLFDGTERHLELSVNGNILSPRMRLMSVPYAIRSGSAALATNLNGGSVNATSVSINGTTVIDATGNLQGNAAYVAGPGIVINGRTVSLPTTCQGGELLRWNSAAGAWACSPFTPPSSDGGVVAYTADPDGGLTLTGSNFTQFSLLRTCTANQVLKWSGSSWTCANDADSVQGVGTNQGLQLAGSNFGLIPCTSGQVLKAGATAGTWACAADTDTDTGVTAVTPGGGIVASIATNTLTVTTDTTIQRRGSAVPAPLSCPTGFLRTVALDGSPTCVTYAGSGVADTVARSDHNHVGVFLPLSATLTCGATDKMTGLNGTTGAVICGTDLTGAGAEVDGVIGNEVTAATNTTLIRAGAGTTASPYTLGLNLSNGNVWNGIQTLDVGGVLSDGTNLEFRGTTSAIRFSAQASSTTAMMTMYGGSSGSGVRPVIGHSPGTFEDWGLLYEDTADAFFINQDATNVSPSIYVPVSTSRVAIGTKLFTGSERLKISGQTTQDVSALLAGGNSAGTSEALRVSFGIWGGGGTPTDYGFFGTASASELYLRVNNTNRVRVTANGDVQIGLGTSIGCIVNGLGNSIVGTCSSDRRLKKNIESFDTMLDKVAQLEPVHFDWRHDEFPKMQLGKARTLGLIAQDVEKVFPELVETSPEGFRAVNYAALPLYTLQAVKELKALTDADDGRLAALEQENAALKQRTEQQEARLRALESRGELKSDKLAAFGPWALAFGLLALAVARFGRSRQR